MIAYRREVDGLRALAVIPVILFHAGVELFSGGFVGVDVFFVISGYLITSIIVAEKEQQVFTILGFYERRVRRILPALLFMVAVCIPFALMWMLPIDVKRFSESVAAVTVFASNILFWRESGYFDFGVELKPLLHTWSLAVEEQYYVFFPLLVVAMWPLGKVRLVISLIVVALASLALAQWGSAHKPSANFYLLPTRAWELLVGSFVALYFAGPRRIPFHRVLYEMGGVAGIVFIGFAIFGFDESIPFPSLYTLAPTVGTVLVLLFARQETTVGYLLSSRPFVGIGLVSYSAYLWHQPLFAFAKQQTAITLFDRAYFILVPISLVMAALSWRFVEMPFRRRDAIARKTLFAAAGLASVLLLSFGVMGHITNGFEKEWMARLAPDERRLYALIMEEENVNTRLAHGGDGVQDNGDCRFNVGNLTVAVTERLRGCLRKYGKGVAVLGDSHAIDLYGVMSVAMKEAHFLVGFTKAGCRPHSPLPDCHYDEFLGFVKDASAFSIVLFEQAGFYLLRTRAKLVDREMFALTPLWGKVPTAFPNEEFVRTVHNYLKEVNKYVPVVWFGPRIEPHILKRDILRLGCRHRYQLRDGQAEIFNQLDDFVRRQVDHDGAIRYISQNSMFHYDFSRDFMTCDSVFWADGDHLSQAGEARFAARVDLNRLLGVR